MDCISKENLKRWREKNKKSERKCVVCGNNFEIEMDKKYVVKSIEAVMIVYYDAIDCPKCGCQNIIWKRLEKVNKFVEKTKK